jgi:hypothetical protein
MRKIPTIFERDWDGDRSRVLPTPTPGCEWVFEGEGNALRKYDGTAVFVDAEGNVFKRLELRGGKAPPEGFLQVDDDMNTGKVIGWVQIGYGSEDKWYRDALARRTEELPEGTYELVGPKVQGNPEGFAQHELVRHDFAEGVGSLDRSFEGIREFLSDANWEGIVFHHPDGRMAKIKARDFGIKRG